MAEDARGSLRRFLFEQHALRGHHVDLGAAWQALRGVHAYPPAVETLLGEAVAASVLLAATLKFSGRLTLQFNGNGAVTLLVAQCTHDFRVRAVAQHDDEVPPLADFATLIGDGRLTVTIESGAEGGRYQGIVPLDPAGIASSLEAYFTSSEQLPTALSLTVHHGRAAGLLIQRLPAATAGEAAAARAAEVWEVLQAQLRALAPEELLLPTESLLPTLSGEFDSRLFAATPVEFHCGCNAGRVDEVLRALGIEELRDIVREQGSVTVNCEFCRRTYRFDGIDIEGLFAVSTPPAPSRPQ